MTVRVTREAEPQIEIYGAYSGELLGGAEGFRVSLTFTPTDDYVILVPKGAVTNTQLEEGVQTSYIPTAGATVTRPADALSIDSTLLPYDSTAMTIAMDGEMTYADTGVGFDTGNIGLTAEVMQWRWSLNPTENSIAAGISTAGGRVGWQYFGTEANAIPDSVFTPSDVYSPGINVPFNIASRHTSSDVNGAVDGTALTADTTPTTLPDLSATDFDIAPTGVVNIKSLRILGGYGATDAELEAATT